MMRETIILAVLDGWGVGQNNESNPIYAAEPKIMNYIRAFFPSAALQASGIAVGLPWEEEGNSEVGHLTLGAGKILFQHFERISSAITDGSFFNASALKNAFSEARKKNSAVHLIGLLSEGTVHAAFDHLKSLIEMAKKENCEKLYLNLFSDGRDSAPHSALNLLERLKVETEKNGLGVITSFTGRYYGMDRDGNWDRTKKAYEMLFGEGEKTLNLEDFINKAYKRDLTDEFISPVIVGEPKPITDNDSLIFFNFREDRMRQITEPFINPNFNKFPAKKLNNLYLVTMTPYNDKFPTNIAFINEKAEKSLGRILAENNKVQLRIAETEKYAHVTYFFNGLEEEPLPNEFRILVPSQKVLHHESQPEMMASQITDRALATLNEGSFDFILINYANPDIVAHSGNFDATVKAIKVVDNEIDRLLKAVLAGNHTLLITSDHGNAEVLIDPKTGDPETKHNISPVPIYLVNKKFQKKEAQNILNQLPVIGLLSDVAPTILALMNIEKPAEMTGQNLLPQLL
ncbi:MAG: 2,3-bisphosphoglycerate-independent phosphoglycerate mutase [Patescibacteria group bacterium]